MSKPETKRAVAYVRVSSLSQVDGHSLDAQARLFNEICANRGWVPVNVYREEGASAHSESIKKRPMFRQLMEDAKKGAFDIVVVHTLDRWSRNLRVTLESLANLAMHDVALVSITEDIDYSTPQGMLMTQLLGSFAQFFSNMLGTHVSKGLDQRATLGLHTGGIPVPITFPNRRDSQGADVELYSVFRTGDVADGRDEVSNSRLIVFSKSQ